MKNFVYTFWIVIFMLFAGACIKKPKYPSEPEIAYVDFLRYGNNYNDPDSVELVVSFTDNEGDIGLEQSDTFGIFATGNFWMIYSYYDSLTNQWSYDWDPATPQVDTFKIGMRVPPVLPDEDDSEPVKGLIFAKQEAPFRMHSKIKYLVYVYDKALHKSNVIETPPLEFDQ
jgi:hypothetical protein